MGVETRRAQQPSEIDILRLELEIERGVPAQVGETAERDALAPPAERRSASISRTAVCGRTRANRLVERSVGSPPVRALEQPAGRDPRRVRVRWLPLARRVERVRPRSASSRRMASRRRMPAYVSVSVEASEFAVEISRPAGPAPDRRARRPRARETLRWCPSPLDLQAPRSLGRAVACLDSAGGLPAQVHVDGLTSSATPPGRANGRRPSRSRRAGPTGDVTQGQGRWPRSRGHSPASGRVSERPTDRD